MNDLDYSIKTIRSKEQKFGKNREKRIEAEVQWLEFDCSIKTNPSKANKEK